MTAITRRRASSRATMADRGIVSAADRRDRRTRWGLRALQGATLVFLLVVGLGPVLWMIKSSVTATQDTLRTPLALWPHGIDLGQLATAWSRTHIDQYLVNTVVIAAGSWVAQLIIATTGGYALSVLRPRFGGVITGLVLATLFVPPIVLLVPLYLTIVDVPLVHARLIDNYWAIWLPAGASAVNVVLVKRFFDNLPRELFEAARIDGAGSVRLFFTIVLPLSKPILGVVSIFAILAEWRNFLWPYLVLTNSPDRQPLSVRLPAIQAQTQLGVLLAAMLIAALVPILAFLVFQRTFIRGQGFSGALKG